MADYSVSVNRARRRWIDGVVCDNCGYMTDSHLETPSVTVLITLYGNLLNTITYARIFEAPGHGAKNKLCPKCSTILARCHQF